MRALTRHRPTPEQIEIITRIRAGVTIIRGAAGSGKTSTALFSLRASAGATVNQLKAAGTLPARILVITYYNSLKGYIERVAAEELSSFGGDVDITISTFDKWASDVTGYKNIDVTACEQKLRQLASDYPKDLRFTTDEITYVLGRFKPNDLSSYIATTRTGRGSSPPMDRAARALLAALVARAYRNRNRRN